MQVNGFTWQNVILSKVTQTQKTNATFSLPYVEIICQTFRFLFNLRVICRSQKAIKRPLGQGKDLRRIVADGVIKKGKWWDERSKCRGEWKGRTEEGLEWQTAKSKYYKKKCHIETYYFISLIKWKKINVGMGVLFPLRSHSLLNKNPSTRCMVCPMSCWSACNLVKGRWNNMDHEIVLSCQPESDSNILLLTTHTLVTGSGEIKLELNWSFLPGELFS